MMNYLKKYGFAIAGSALLAGIILPMNSCDWGSSPSTAQDTIHLATLPGDIVLTGLDSTATVGLKLTCGCPFRLNYLQSSGDTAQFTFKFLLPDTSKSTPHPIVVGMNPSAPPHHSYSGWMLFSAVDHLGGTDYDTLRFSATIP